MSSDINLHRYFNLDKSSKIFFYYEIIKRYQKNNLQLGDTIPVREKKKRFQLFDYGFIHITLTPSLWRIIKVLMKLVDERNIQSIRILLNRFSVKQANVGMESYNMVNNLQGRDGDD